VNRGQLGRVYVAALLSIERTRGHDTLDKGPQTKKRLIDPVNGLTHLVGGLLCLIWGLALCGVLLKLLWMDAPR
jgi:hypothetical protein